MDGSPEETGEPREIAEEVPAAAYELVQDAARCAEVVGQLLQEPEVAVDIEGVDLCRAGEVCLIQVADGAGRTFLFDICVLGAAAFEEGRLGELLRDPSCCKVVCDGRADNDALSHIYGVAMENIYDLQVLHALKFSSKQDKYVKGLEKVLEAAEVQPLERRQQLQAIKKRGRELFAPELGGSYEAWKARPLTGDLVDYAAADVECILLAKRKWCSPTLDPLVRRLTEERIRKAIASPEKPKGAHMAIRDFSLDGGESVDKVLPPKICFTFRDTGRCRHGLGCSYAHTSGLSAFAAQPPSQSGKIKQR